MTFKIKEILFMDRRPIPTPTAAAPAPRPDVLTNQSDAKMNRFCFEGYVVDRLRWEVRRQEDPIKLSRKSLDVLLYLIDHRDRVVSKDELLQQLWSGQIVEESNLTQHVFLIRRALSVLESGVKTIDTVMRRGYRFIAELEHGPSHAAPSAPQVRHEVRFPELLIRQSTRSAPAVAFNALRAAVLSAAAAILALGLSAADQWHTPGSSPSVVARLVTLKSADRADSHPAGTLGLKQE